VNSSAIRAVEAPAILTMPRGLSLPKAPFLFDHARPLKDILRHAYPDPQLPRGVLEYRMRNYPRLCMELAEIEMARRLKIPVMMGAHFAIVERKRGRGLEILGLTSLHKVSQAFTVEVVDCLQDSEGNPIDVYNFHNFGTDATAEANTQNDLILELAATEWVEAARPAGTQTEGASTNIYRSEDAGPLTVDTAQGPIAIEEVAVFLSATFGVVGVIDRGVTGTITLDDDETITNSYEYTAQPEA
jgi:hypothetical protein